MTHSSFRIPLISLCVLTLLPTIAEADDDKPKQPKTGTATVTVPPTKEGSIPKRPSLTLYDLMDDWFWVDPYSHLGDVSRNGDGWRFVRLAGDAEAAKELRTAKEQLQALRAIYDIFQIGGPPGTTASGIPLWNIARQAAEPLLGEEQKKRLAELMIQRRTYHAMLEVSLQEQLGLSPDQRKQIQASVDRHNKRIAGAEKKLAKTLESIAEQTGSRKLTEKANSAKAEKLHSG